MQTSFTRAGSIIGPDSETTELRYRIPGQVAVVPFVTGLPATFNHPGQGNFVGEKAYLGFRFEGDEGTHDGYAPFPDTTDRGTTLLVKAWENEPGKAIIAGAIPEPSAALFYASRECPSPLALGIATSRARTNPHPSNPSILPRFG